MPSVLGCYGFRRAVLVPATVPGPKLLELETADSSGVTKLDGVPLGLADDLSGQGLCREPCQEFTPPFPSGLQGPLLCHCGLPSCPGLILVVGITKHRSSCVMVCRDLDVHTCFTIRDVP
ncbi:hypothetical protein NDU88_003611 [Pleurodeles waltl]|uniref:Uncharacterized protein n=1 Tax=Pleurodeles waltl TaxID=8319 RepID=A0AAV7TQ80_PLEWA|nr:hypothetical protein NDU88_003611 [Pleurodeles waltl]